MDLDTNMCWNTVLLIYKTGHPKQQTTKKKKENKSKICFSDTITCKDDSYSFELELITVS